jgi:hypothetical protein
MLRKVFPLVEQTGSFSLVQACSQSKSKKYIATTGGCLKWQICATLDLMIISKLLHQPKINFGYVSVKIDTDKTLIETNEYSTAQV